MRILLLSFGCLLISLITNAQNQIPNNSFEFWVKDTISYPDGYFSSGVDTSDIYSNTCTPSTNSYSGNYSLRLESIIQGPDTAVGHIINSISSTVPLTPFSFAADSVHGYFKSNIVGSDEGLVRVQLFQNGFDIGSATFPFTASTNTSSWTKFSFPISILNNAVPQAILFEAFSSDPENPLAVENGSWLMLDSIYFSNVSGSTDTLNNFDFERWTEKSIEQLEGFNSNILRDPSLNTPLIEKVTDATDGDYATRINTYLNDLGLIMRGVISTGEFEQEGILWQGGTPFTGKPNFLTFDYQFNYVTPDYTIVAVQFTKNGNWIFTSEVSSVIFTPTTGYQSDTINLTFNESPDTLVLMALGGDYPGTSLVLDNFVFHYLVGISKNTSLFRVESYPNPTNDYLNFEIESIKNLSTTISIINILGKTIQTKNYEILTGLNQITMDVNHLKSGNYIFQFEIEGQSFSGKFVKN